HVRGAEMPVRLGAVAARDGDVELGVAPHSVLGDVEAGRLDVLLDADSPEPLQRPEAAERSGEGEAADRDQTECLDSDLVERARVDETAAAGGEVRGQRRYREQPGCQRAPDARETVHRDGSDRI